MGTATTHCNLTDPAEPPTALTNGYWCFHVHARHRGWGRPICVCCQRSCLWSLLWLVSLSGSSSLLVVMLVGAAVSVHLYCLHTG